LIVIFIKYQNSRQYINSVRTKKNKAYLNLHGS